MLGMDTQYTIEIDRPAAEVWSILSDDFASIGDFLTAVPASRSNGDPNSRTCETPYRGFSEVTETIIERDHEAMTYTYVASSVPKWIGTPKNTWFVEEIDEHRCRAGFRPEIQATAFGKVVLRFASFSQDGFADGVLEDLKYFAEHGTPSPAKIASLAKRS